MNSICENCRNKRDTWSDKLKADGYIGCVIGYHDESNMYDITAEVVATGWVKLVMMTNGMIITKNTTKCPHFIEEKCYETE